MPCPAVWIWNHKSCFNYFFFFLKICDCPQTLINREYLFMRNVFRLLSKVYAMAGPLSVKIVYTEA